MNEKESNYANDEMIMEFIVDECINDAISRKRYFPQHIRKENTEKIDYKHLEEVFSDETYYKAMKNLPLSEKFAIYVYVFRGEYLDRLCKDYNLSKQGFIELKNCGVKRFKKNVKKYSPKKQKKKKFCKKDGGFYG